MRRGIPLSKPDLSFLEFFEVFKALSSGWLTQAGPQCRKMKSMIHDAVDWTHQSSIGDVSVCSNGTTALHLALLSLNLNPGDEVIVPNFGYIAAVNSVINTGATPVLVDVKSDWTICPKSVERSITKNTKAIICIDNYGVLCDYNLIRKSVNPGIKIIQDAAESFPGRDLKTGFAFLGDIAILSFYANKFVTAGEGGAVVAESSRVTQIDKLKSQNTSGDGSFRHLGLGFNYRITNLQASIFVAQWKRRRRFLKKRISIFNTYAKHWPGNDKIITNNFQANPWLCTVQFALSSQQRDALRLRLNELGIETRSGFTPASEHQYILEKARIYDDLSKSLKISSQIISFPTYTQITHSTLMHVIKTVISELECYRE
jgi:perosamine synthetase